MKKRSKKIFKRFKKATDQQKFEMYSTLKDQTSDLVELVKEMELVIIGCGKNEQCL